jgi:hypothetical protein
VSKDGGASFGPVRQIETDNARQVSVAICKGRYLYAVYAVDLRSPITPNKWSIIAYERDLDTGAQSAEQLSFGNGTARHPDVACGKDRVWVAWDDRDAPDPRTVRLTHSVIGPPGVHDWVLPVLDLGLIDASTDGPSVAAVTGHGAVAWIADTGDLVVRLKRYTVGAGPAFPVAGLATKTIAAPGTDDYVVQRIAATGSRVALCLQRSGVGTGMFVRMSSDHGASFGAAKLLPVPAPYGGIVESCAVRGAHVLVEAAIYLEGQADTYRYRSTNGGATFKRTMLDDNRGNRIGALLGPLSGPKVVEAWDAWLYNGRKLRTHHQT